MPSEIWSNWTVKETKTFKVSYRGKHVTRGDFKKNATNQLLAHWELEEHHVCHWKKLYPEGVLIVKYQEKFHFGPDKPPTHS